MNAALRDRLFKQLAYKTTELTVGEAICCQSIKRDNDVRAWVTLLASRVTENEHFEKLKPSDLWDLTLSELVELTQHVFKGIEGEGAQQLMPSLAKSTVIH